MIANPSLQEPVSSARYLQDCIIHMIIINSFRVVQGWTGLCSFHPPAVPPAGYSRTVSSPDYGGTGQSCSVVIQKPYSILVFCA